MKLLLENFKKFLNEEVDAEEMETLTHLAQNGDCGVFAIALLKELISAGVTNAALNFIGDPDHVDDPDYHSDTTPRSIDVWYDVDIFHVVVVAVEGGAWGMFDINGRVSQDKMLEYFVPYGGGGITPDDYTPQYGRDWISDIYDVPSMKALNWFQDFLEATTNVQTSVENYTKTAQRMAKSILKN